MTALAAAMAVPRAEAFPPTGAPTVTAAGPLFGHGAFGTTAIYAYADAGDQDQLFLTPNAATIFDNKANNPGDTADLGVLSGSQVFGVRDLSVVNTFLTDLPDINGGYHAYYSPICDSVATCNVSYLNFSVGALDPAVAAIIGGIPAGTDVVFVGWEDRAGGDWDFNDLIFALTNLRPTAIPEPASMALLGAALLGFGAMARRRSA